jgi:hypothetical protein
MRFADAHVNIDGGRSDLPGMKQDMFDRVQKNKKGGPQQRGKAPPDCPRSDGMSPFVALAFVDSDIFVKLNSSEEKCVRLISVGGANYTDLMNASKTCGPVGEWKRRIAEETSAVFFQGGFEWVKSENETIEVITEEGTFQSEISEAKFAELLECWKRSCGCEQAQHPKMRMVFLALFVICLGGLGGDAFKLLRERIVGKKPPKHVLCKNGHKIEEVKYCGKRLCDLCGVVGTIYQCNSDCNYDLCKACYKTSKKKVKEELAAWYEKHPKDPDAKEAKEKEEAEKRRLQRERRLKHKAITAGPSVTVVLD